MTTTRRKTPWFTNLISATIFLLLFLFIHPSSEGQDIASATFVQSKDVFTDISSPNGITLNSDGTAMFLCGTSFATEDVVYTYDLSVAYDLSTAVRNVAKTFVMGNSEYSITPQDLVFKADGSVLFVVGSYFDLNTFDMADSLYSFSLSTPFDVSTAVLENRSKFSVALEEDFTSGVELNSDGSKIFIIGKTNDQVIEYNLSVAHDITTASVGSTFSVNVETGSPESFRFSQDGLMMYAVHLDMGANQSAVYTYSLSSAYDISTATFAGPGESLVLDFNDIRPSGLAFGGASKMYLFGTNGSGSPVREYDLEVTPDDVTPPVVTVDLLVTNVASPELTGTVDDATATIEVTVGGNAYAATNNGATWTLDAGTITPDLTEGTYEVSVSATDPANNVGTDDTSDELIVDLTVPTVTIDALVTNVASPELTGTVDDASALIEVTVGGNAYAATNNGTTWTLDAGTITPDLTEGTYDVSVSATDMATNAGTDDTADELTVDLTAPIVTVDALTTNVASPELTGTIDDATAAIEVTVGGSAYTATNNGTTWTLAAGTITPDLADDTYEVSVSATDAATNTGTDATTNELVIDTTTPVVTVDALTTNVVSPELTGTIDDASATIEVTVGGNTYTATNNGTTWTLDAGTISPDLADDTYEVSVSATDGAGNIGTDETETELTIDLVSPGVAIVDESGNAPTAVSGDFTILIAFVEPGAEVAEAVTGFDVSEIVLTNAEISGDLTSFGDAYVVTVSPDGNGTITIAIAADAAMDLAGNGNTSISLEILYDIDPPTVTISGAPASVSYYDLSPFSVSFEFSEALAADEAGFDLTDIAVTNGAVSNLLVSNDPLIYTADITPDGQGDISIEVGGGTIQDLAGNALVGLVQENITMTGPFSGGTGTSQDPYQIENKTDLKNLSDHSSFWSSHFIQTADITFEVTDFGADGSFYYDGQGFSPIGRVNHAFDGSYDGDGHVIYGLTITRADQNNIGMFGYIAGSVSNIGLSDLSVTGKEFVGGLVGAGVANISSSYASGEVNGDTDVGGLIGGGSMTSAIRDSYSMCTVNGNSEIGGLIGSASSTTLSNAYAAGVVSGNSSVGGFIGSIDGSSVVTGCFWNTKSSGQESGVGSGDEVSTLLGITTDEMRLQSTFTGAEWDFTDTWQMDNGCVTGGFPILKWQDNPEAVQVRLGEDVSQCGGTVTLDAGTSGTTYLWSTGATTQTIDVTTSGTYSVVSSKENVCDGADEIEVTIFTQPEFTLAAPTPSCGEYTIDGPDGFASYSWSNGESTQSITVTASGTYTLTVTNEDGCTAEDEVEVIVNEIPVITVAGAENPACGGIEFTLTATATIGEVTWYDTETKDNVLSTEASFTTTISKATNFWVEAVNADCNSLKEVVVNAKYCYSGGTGTETDPYLISNKYDLDSLTNSPFDYSKHFLQTENISFEASEFAEGAEFYNAGFGIALYHEEFTGSYDGGYHTIDGMVYIWPYVAGLFYYLDGEVKNLGLTNLSLTSDPDNAGGLANIMYEKARIENCFTTGAMKADISRSLGGLVGLMYGGAGTIINSYSTVSVETIDARNTGGLVGETRGGSIVNSYATGFVKGATNTGPGVPLSEGGLVGRNEGAVITNCFWDTETSGRTGSAGGTGLTTAQMKDPYTFVDAGWDFKCIGSEEIWDMDLDNINGGYPILGWQSDNESCLLILDAEGTSNTVTIYPSFTRGLVTIQTQGRAVDQIEVYDMMGRRVLFQDINAMIQETKIDLSGERPGIYLVRILSGSTQTTHRVILQK
ncbi:MAG: Ig-like domain-containing protein [Marinoscillum sp.]|uniref:Ig-like domain-containing protein n=1 Tax=Marinoscillum sp. TaxID=2024838 RepID=UPI0032F3E6B0